MEDRMMTTKKTKKQTNAETEVAAETLTPRQHEEIKKRVPLRAMIAKGKDETEATLLWTIGRLLDEINWEVDDPFFAKDLTPEHLANYRSLKWNANKVFTWLVRQERESGNQ